MDDNIIKTYNTTFSEIVQDYLTVSNSLHNNDNISELKSQGIISIDDLVEFEIALNTLAIQLQNIKYKLNLVNSAENSNTKTNQQLSNKNVQDDNTSKLVNNALSDLMPLIMIHMLNNDAYSILNNNSVINNFKEKVKKASIPTPLSSTNQQSLQHTNSQTNLHQHSYADDVD